MSKTMLVAIFALATRLFAQQSVPPNNTVEAKMVIDMMPGETHLSAPPLPSEGIFGRWISLDTASVMTRYRYVQNFVGITTATQQQHQVAFAGDLHLDSEGRVSVHAGLYSGSTFLGGWNTTGPGTGVPQANLHLKQLFLRLAPVAGVELQYGGLGFARGESSEITSYDADGYLVGERVILKRPRNLFFDELSATYGYIGDLNRPNVISRFGRMAESNYHQFLAAKKLSRALRASADYSSESGQRTFHQALTLRTSRARLVDLMRFEQYERIGTFGGYGYAVYGEKRLGQRLTLGTGFTDHDRTGLYADRFSVGKYLFENYLFALTPSVSLSALFTQGISSPQPNAPQSRIDIAIGYNLRRDLRRVGL